MATVTVVTAERTLEIEANSVTGGHIDGSGHLILTTFDATEIDCGSVVGSISSASDTVQGIVELATDTETITGTDSARAVTPFGLSALTAADTRRGLVELATNAEVATGTDTTRAVTPAGLTSLVASDTAKGIVELATNAETATGTDAVRAVTPAALAALIATDVIRGLVELATNAETATGTDATRAVTPAALASLIATSSAKGIVQLATTTEATTGTDTAKAITAAGVQAVRALLQPLDSDLTTIAGLTATTDNVIQSKSGAWASRTMAQLATDLAATGEFPDMMLYSGGSYGDADGAKIYCGSADPGSVTNGSVWFTIP